MNDDNGLQRVGSTSVATFEPRDFTELERLAERCIKAKLFAVQSADAALIIMLTGASLGLSPVPAMRGIHVIDGKAVLSADLLVAVVLKSGQCLRWTVVETTAEQCVIETHRKGQPEPARHVWTMAMARTAGLSGRGNWNKYPAAMLRARCSAELARIAYPDVMFGVYVEGELEGEAVEAVPAPLRIVAPPAEPTVDPLAAYRARLAATSAVDELVAAVLALAPSVAAHRETAWGVAQARSAELGTGDLTPRVQAAAAITKDPAAWTVVALVLAGLALATSKPEVGAVVRLHGAAVGKLPEALQVQLNAARTARLNALCDLAAGFEAELHAAGDIPTLEGIGDRIVDAFTAQRLTPDQMKKLADLQDRLCSGMERAA